MISEIITTELTDVFIFWFKDSLKILILMSLLFYVINFLQTYFPPEKMSGFLSGKGIIRYPLAAFFGSLSPFCSCSTIPLFLGFLRAGVKIGATLTFLLTSPLINLAAIPIMWNYFGWQITLIYVIIGVTISITTGVILERLGFEKNIERGNAPQSNVSNRWKTALSKTKEQVNEYYMYVLAGTLIGALVRGYLPSYIIQDYATGIFAIPIAVLIAVPLYTNIFAVIPIASSLIQKGLPIEVALVFLIAAAGLSLPEFIMLSKPMDKKLLTATISITTIGIILSGYILTLI